MDIRDFQILIDLYHYKNITRVSEIHYISQPAITKRIQKIENELNCQLVVSNNKGIIFTKYGENIMPYCRQIINEYNSLMSSISQTNGTVGGSINILSSPNYSRYRLPLVLKSFAKIYPSVNLNINMVKSKDILSKLLKETNFIGIIRCVPSTIEWGVENILLSTEPMCFICSHENLNRSLMEYQYIDCNFDETTALQIERWGNENKLSIGSTTKVIVDNTNSCKEMVELGLGWSIVPRICLDDFDGVIHDLYFEDGTPFMRETHLLYHNSYYELEQVKLFINTIIETEKQFI